MTTWLMEKMMAQYSLEELFRAQHYLGVLISKGSVFQQEIREALWVSAGLVNAELKKRAIADKEAQDAG